MVSAERQERADRAQQIYDEQIKPLLEPTHSGEFLELNVDTGEYVFGKSDLGVAEEAMRRFPGARLFGFRIGHRAMYRCPRMKLADPRPAIMDTMK